MKVINKITGKTIRENCRLVSRTESEFTVEYKKLMPTFQDGNQMDYGRDVCMQNVREKFKISDFEFSEV